MSEEDSDSVITDSQAEEEGELPVIQLCGLVEELSYGNSALKTETEMFEKYYSRLEPRDHRMTRLSDIKITAAEFSQLRFRRKSKARGGLDRTLGLTVEQKLELVQKELEDTRDEIRHMRANAERDLQHHEAIIEEADIRWNEVQKAVHEFEKDILKTISKKKGSILATQKVMKYIEDMNRRRDNIKDKLCLKNVSLKVQRKKMLSQLRQKEEVGEALHDVDFQQLKIENAQFLEMIEARNKELIQLKLASGNTLQVLNTYKNKLHRAMEIYVNLDKEILLRNELLGKIEKETIQAEEVPRIQPGSSELHGKPFGPLSHLYRPLQYILTKTSLSILMAVQCFACIYVCAPVCLPGVQRNQKREWGPLELEDRAKAHILNDKLRKQLAEFRAPQVMMYVKEKILNGELEKTIKMWERKVEIAEMSLKGYRKAWNKMKTSDEQLQIIRPPGK